LQERVARGIYDSLLQTLLLHDVMTDDIMMHIADHTALVRSAKIAN